MAVTPPLFSRELVNDYGRFKSLFNGEEELKQIEKFYNEPQKPEGSKYYNRWQVAAILIKQPFKMILGVFLECVRLLSYPFSRSIYAYTSVWIRHLERELYNLFHIRSYGTRLLVPTLNWAQTSIGDVFTQKPMKKEDILSPEIRKSVNNDEIVFDRSGVCEGGVNWFNFLLIGALLGKFHRIDMTGENFKKVLISVAKVFEKGMPRQAALLQAFWGIESSVLNNETVLLEKISIDKPKTEILNALNNLPIGIYLLKLMHEETGHAVSYIKYKNLQFIWDPNCGLIEIQNSDQLYEIAKIAEKDIFARRCNLKGPQINENQGVA